MTAGNLPPLWRLDGSQHQSVRRAVHLRREPSEIPRPARRARHSPAANRSNRCGCDESAVTKSPRARSGLSGGAVRHRVGPSWCRGRRHRGQAGQHRWLRYQAAQIRLCANPQRRGAWGCSGPAYACASVVSMSLEEPSETLIPHGPLFEEQTPPGRSSTRFRKHLRRIVFIHLPVQLWFSMK